MRNVSDKQVLESVEKTIQVLQDLKQNQIWVKTLAININLLINGEPSLGVIQELKELSYFYANRLLRSINEPEITQNKPHQNQ